MLESSASAPLPVDRSGDRGGTFFWNHVFRRAMVGYLRFVHRLRYVGGDPVPMEGPVIVVSNHESYQDPLIISLGVRRWLRWMAWDALFRIPILAAWLRLVGAFPVSFRSSYRGSYRQAAALLDIDEAVGIFFEGGITRTGDLGVPHPGAARLAVRSRIPVVPVAVTGAYRCWPPGPGLPRPGRIAIRYFPPILPGPAPDPRAAAGELTDRILETIRPRVAAANRALAEIDRRYAGPAAPIRGFEVLCAMVPLVAHLAGGPPWLLAAAVLPGIYALCDRAVKQDAVAKHVRDAVPLLSLVAGVAAGAGAAPGGREIAGAAALFLLAATGFRRRGARAYRRFAAGLALASAVIPAWCALGAAPPPIPAPGVLAPSIFLAVWHLRTRRFRYEAYAAGAAILLAALWAL